MKSDNQSCANLTTLKDINMYCYECDWDSNKEELRQEGIKWVKYMITKKEVTFRFRQFFNITEEDLKGSDKKDDCSFGNRCDKCRTIMTTTHKKDEHCCLKDHTHRVGLGCSTPCGCKIEFKGSDKKDETTSTDCLDKLTRLEKSYQKEIAELKDTHKKDYPNVALSEKLMTGLTEKQYDKAVKE